MGRKKKHSMEQILRAEKRFATLIRDKLNALSSAQLKENNYAAKSKDYFSERKPQKTSQRSCAALKTELSMLLQSTGFLKPHVINPDAPVPTREQKLMARFDFEGLIIKPNPNDLSEAYTCAMQERNNELYKIDGLYFPNCYTPADYNLNDSPAWREMQKFDTINTMAKRLRIQMAKQDIPPQIVGKLNYFDFMDLALSHYRETKIKPFESARSRNFKMFAACYHDEFSSVMGRLGYKPEYTRNLLHKMRNGTCDDLLNFHHNPNIQHCTDNGDISQTSHFSNMVLTFVTPCHRSFHYPVNMDVDPSLVFVGGYGALLQIRHNPERERQYLLQHPSQHRNEVKLLIGSGQGLKPDAKTR